MPLAPARVLLQHADQEVREVRLRRMPRNRKPFFESRRMRVHVFRREEDVKVEGVNDERRAVADADSKVRLRRSLL